MFNNCFVNRYFIFLIFRFTFTDVTAPLNGGEAFVFKKIERGQKFEINLLTCGRQGHIASLKGANVGIIQHCIMNSPFAHLKKIIHTPLTSKRKTSNF